VCSLEGRGSKFKRILDLEKKVIYQLELKKVKLFDVGLSVHC